MHSPISTGVTIVLSPSTRLMHARGLVGLRRLYRPPLLDLLQSAHLACHFSDLVRSTCFDTYSGLMDKTGPTQYDTSSPICLVSPTRFSLAMYTTPSTLSNLSFM